MKKNNEDAKLSRKFKANIGKEIISQNNESLDNPMFVVYSSRKILGISQDCGGDGYVWIDTKNENQILAENEAAIVESMLKDTDIKPDAQFQKVYYKQVWVFEQSFFTRTAANEYVANKNDFGGFMVSEEKGCNEWSAARDLFITCVRKPKKTEKTIDEQAEKDISVPCCESPATA